MIATIDRHRSPSGRRSVVILVAAFIALVATLLTAAPASADQPWEYPGQNAHNYRRSTDAPARNIGCCGSTGPKQAVWQRTFDSDVTGTPIAARNGGIYVGDRRGVLHALLYSNGHTVCSQNVGQIGTNATPSPITGSALYLASKNTLYVVGNKLGRPRLIALNPLNCDPIWSVVLDTQANWEATEPTYSPIDDLIFLGTCVCSAEEKGTSGVGGRGSVVAVDPDTGQVVWKTYTVAPAFNGGAVAGSPVLYPDGRVFVGTDHAFVGSVADPNTDAVLQLNPVTGAIIGSFQARVNDIATTSNPDPTKRLGFEAPLVVFPSNGTKLIGAGDRGGTFYAIDPNTMLPVAQVSVGVGSSAGGVTGLTVDPTGKGTVHGVTATPTTFFGINASTGALIYQHPGLDPVQNGLPSFASNAVWSTNGTGFADIQDPTNGRILGRLRLGAPSTGGIAFYKRTAYIAIGTGDVTDATGGGIAAFK